MVLIVDGGLIAITRPRRRTIGAKGSGGAGYAAGVLAGSGVAMLTLSRTHKRRLVLAADEPAGCVTEPGVVGVVAESYLV